MRDRLEFASFNGEAEVKVGQGADCVMLLVDHRDGRRLGIVMTPDETEALARSLRLRARYAREAVSRTAAHDEADEEAARRFTAGKIGQGLG